MVHGPREPLQVLTYMKKDVVDKLHKQLKENIDKKLARLIAQSQHKAN